MAAFLATALVDRRGKIEGQMSTLCAWHVFFLFFLAEGMANTLDGIRPKTPTQRGQRGDKMDLTQEHEDGSARRQGNTQLDGELAAVQQGNTQVPHVRQVPAR